MGTNNFRQTYDRNIARNPSTCRKCNANDEVHDINYDINKCANECKSATDVDKVVCKTKDNLNTCFKDPQKNNGCRPCKEIVFKFTNTSGTLITVNIGNNCA